MTIIRTEQPLTYPERHDHQHAGRVAWWLRGPESWGCVFQRGPVSDGRTGDESAGAKPESLEFSDSCLDNTHFPTLSSICARAQTAQEHEQATTLAIAPSGAFWRTQSPSGEWTATPVASELAEALQSAVAAPETPPAA